eukprot:1056372-Amphidinium_carterae.2
MQHDKGTSTSYGAHSDANLRLSFAKTVAISQVASMLRPQAPYMYKLALHHHMISDDYVDRPVANEQHVPKACPRTL